MLKRASERLMMGVALSGFVYFGRTRMFEIFLVSGSVFVVCAAVIAARIAYIASHTNIVVQKKE